MTTEKAIQLLHRLQDEQFDGPHGDERREALEMAVMALSGNGDTISRKAVMREFSDFVRKSNNSDFAPTPTWNDAVSLVGSMPSAQPETHEKRTETHACDLISREVAIDAVNEYLRLSEVSKTVQNMTSIQAVLRWLPSAQPERDTPIKPKETTDTAWGIPARQAVCPKCDYYLGHVAFLGDYKGKRITYCETCGQAIDWEGWDFDE